MRDVGAAGGADPEAYDAAEELDQLEAQDSQTGGADPNETGYSPPERPLGMREELTLDERLVEDEPDTTADLDWDGVGDPPDGDGEPIDEEAGRRRAGRLVEADDDLTAQDVGIDGGAASAEEAAMHVADDEWPGA